MAKRVPLRAGKDGVDAKKIFVGTLENAPPGGMGFAEMRKRDRVLQAIDKAGAYVDLEDADWQTLKAAVEGQQNFQAVPAGMMRWMIEVQDDLLNAKAPPPPPPPVEAAQEVLED